MKKYAYYIGADVSKKTIDISVLKGKEKLFHLRINNDEKGFKALKKELQKHGILAKKSILCLENTGFYGYSFSCWAVENAYPVWIENAIAIKRSLGLVRGKNDQVDSHRIALYAARFEDKCKLWQPPRKAVQRLQQLIATRTRLIESRNRLKTPLKELSFAFSKNQNKEVETCCKAAIKGIEKSIDKVEEKIDQLIKSDTQLSHMKKIITSVDGIGLQIATALIVATNEFKELKNQRKMACYAGIAPFEHTSGTSIKGRTRVSHLANKSLKTLLHMGAISAIKNSEEIGAYYRRKVEEGKPKMVVINAVRNKLVLRMWACIREDRMYEKTYTKNLAES